MSKYGKILVGLCLADLLLTVFCIKFGFAIEASSFLLFYFNNFGLAGFVASKLYMNALSIFALEATFRFRLMPEKKMRVYYKAAILVSFMILFVVNVAQGL
ncbi:hypothetical protein HZB06_01405 [Candidatus Wolfebacteria bacterium]|nr:hypothetical protein [Candidatus Wolfebacteria bacterium]